MRTSILISIHKYDENDENDKYDDDEGFEKLETRRTEVARLKRSARWRVRRKC